MTASSLFDTDSAVRPALRGAMHRASVPVAICLTVLLAVRAPTGSTRAAVIVYGIMALLFRSWLDPVVILASLPLAAIGAIVALFVTNSTLSLSAMIGMLMLVGIVVTNAIVLIEFVIMLREERGYDLRTALVEGGLTRLRPILMTAVATILALVPLSLGLTEGLLIASDLGRVVIGGLISSTFLTLLVVPVFYSLADGLKRRWASRRRQATPPAPEAAAPVA